VRFETIRQRAFVMVLASGLATAGAASFLRVQAMAEEAAKSEELSRKPKTKVSPVYPEVARRMNIAGTVRLAVVVAPSGAVKSSKAVGGHPVLVNAAVEAIKQWKFEPALTETSGIVEFKFEPQN
jgi:TonB family protein